MKQTLTYLWQSLRRGVLTLGTRPMYLVAMVLVPLGCAWFFASLLDRGLPQRVPTAIVDLDHTAMSRSMTRALDSEQLIDITAKYESYDQAMAAVREGTVFGFYVIPANFERDAVAGRRPTVNYYADMTYFVPGTFAYKGFKTIAVSAAAAALREQATSLGITDDVFMDLAQPVTVQTNMPGNPWTNYAYYLAPSFTYGILELMVLLVTIFSITAEIKNNTSRQWLGRGGGSIMTAVTGKLLPQSLVWIIVVQCIQGLMFGIYGFPFNGHLWVMVTAPVLMVLAAQALGLFIASVLPNPRLALSVAALMGILALSWCGFSFPIEKMYGAIAVFGYMLPVRYLFEVYCNDALNGLPFYYSATAYAVMTGFILLPLTMLWRLKKACLNPVYVP